MIVSKDSEGLPYWLSGKESACQYRWCRIRKIPWRRKPLQYSYLGNSMDSRAWWATVYVVAIRVGHDLATKTTTNKRTQKHKFLAFYFIRLQYLIKAISTKLYLNAAAAKSLQSCLTLCDPIDGSPPGSPVPGILQARTLESVAISFSNAWKWKVKVKSLSRVRLLATSWTAAYQAPPSMAFSRQEYWSGLPLPSPYIWINLP